MSESPTANRRLATRVRCAMWAVLAALVCGVATPAAADQRDPRLPALFAQLGAASSPTEAEQVASQIWDAWNSAGDEKLDRLMRAGSQALGRRELGEALQVFSQLVELAPDFAEGWNKRATAYYQLGDYEASMRDVSVVLELEPRHFAALSGMGLMYTELDADAPALRWFERALEVHPYLIGIREQVAALHRRLDDSGI